jgi:AMMECR1 domain-containing protein
MNKNSIVQIDSKNILDKSLHGCIGFIKSIDKSITEVNIYNPEESGKNAFSKTLKIPNDNLIYIGEPKLKPL